MQTLLRLYDDLDDFLAATFRSLIASRWLQRSPSRALFNPPPDSGCKCP
jgi:hypothetical protein